MLSRINLSVRPLRKERGGERNRRCPPLMIPVVLALATLTPGFSVAEVQPTTEGTEAPAAKPLSSPTAMAAYERAADALKSGDMPHAVEAAREAKTLIAAGTPGVREELVPVLHLRLDTILGAACYAVGDYDAARPILESLLKGGLESESIHSMLGVIASAKRDWPAAEYHLGLAWELTNFSAPAEADLRKSYEARGGPIEGWDAYREALRETLLADLKKRLLASYRSPDRSVPAFDLQSFGSPERYASNKFAGKVAVLSVWATWCGPCRKELPELEKFYRKHLNDAQLTVLTINAEEPATLIEAFLKGRDYTFPIVMDPNPWTRFGIDAIPTTFIVDAAGRIRFTLRGLNASVDYVQLLEWLVEDTTASLPAAASLAPTP